MANIDQVQLPDGSQYHIIDDTSGYATTTYVQNQISTINKNTIGLGSVDNTADINKPVSLPQQDALNGKVDDDLVAYVEGDTTATKRHEVGDQFILNGVLYTATAIIAVNDTIVIGTNCDSAESVATQITENANAIVSLRSDITSINQTGTTATQAISSGTYFYLNGTLVRAKTAIASGATFTLNTNYEVVTVGDRVMSVEDALEWKYLGQTTNHNPTDIPTNAKEIFCTGLFGNMSVMFLTLVGGSRGGYYNSASDNGDFFVTLSNNQLTINNYNINGQDRIAQGVKIYYR